MHEKALQSRRSNFENAKLSYPQVEPYDELAIFGGRTGLVMPKRTFNAKGSGAASSSIRLPSIPNLLHPSPTEMLPPSVPHHAYRSETQLQSVHVNDATSTPVNWEGLYREIPESSYYGHGTAYSNAAAGPANPPGEGVMLEDRWSSFMHQYALGDAQARTRY
jgi:hypothetical protein